MYIIMVLFSYTMIICLILVGTYLDENLSRRNITLPLSSHEFPLLIFIQYE